MREETASNGFSSSARIKPRYPQVLLVVVSDLLASLLFLGASFRLARLTTRQSQLIKSSRSDSNPLGRNAQNEQNVNGAQVQGTDDAFGGLADARKCLVGVDC